MTDASDAWYPVRQESIVIFEMMNPHRHTDQNVAEAATVILTRERAGGLQVYLLQRNPNSGFMGGHYVFPGGVLEPEDYHTRLFQAHSDLDLEALDRRLGGGLTSARALAFCVAAIRETLEEAGVFLARNEDCFEEQVIELSRLRLTGKLPKGWLVSLVRGTRWRLTLTALSHWSHWITPVLMKRRFDTRFFLAEMPADQICRPDLRETVHGLWESPERALTGNLVGKIPLSPPTLVTLHEMLAYRRLNDLQAASHRRPGDQAILPRWVPLPEGAVIIEPWDPLYREKDIQIDPGRLPGAVLAVGEPFSRIWYDGNIWRPVRG